MTDKTTEVHLKMFKGHDAGRERRIINGDYLAEILYPMFKPETVIDLGCGLGFFLSSMQKYGAKITAIDNDWVKELETAAPIKSYVFHDLNQPFASKKRFDLATSFEVAEHLDPERSEPLVQELCALSDTIAFSAAIPGQSGSGHINLKWQSDWAELFEQQGYLCYDAIRPAMAEKENAYFWFRQNALVFIKDDEDVPDNVRGRLIKPEAANQVCRNLYKRKMRRAENEIKKLKKELAKYESGA